MNEDKLNISVRKFLKNVGITSQRKIEEKVREQYRLGNLKQSEKIKISAKVYSKELDLDEEVNGEIEIEI
jgi:hypothetical protein